MREHGVDSYDFSHDKLREVAYNSLSSARRRLNHFHIAQALEKLHGTELDPLCHKLAFHYDRANLPEQAIPFYLRAAEVARQVYANEEALALLQRGISLMGGDRSNVGKGKGNYEDVVHLWEQLGDLLELKAQHENALQAYKKARTQQPQINLIWQARLHRKEGMVWREQRLYKEALEAFHQAEIVLGKQPDEDITNWWDEWLEVQIEQIWAYYWLALWPEMNELLTQVKPVVKERGGFASRIQLLNASCLMHLRRERYIVSDEMLANSIEALAASQELESLKTRIECQFELGFLHLWRREFNMAEENLLAALGLTEISRILPLRTIILTYLTVLCRFQGQVDGVLTYVGLAQKAAEEAQMPDYIAAAKGNLAWLAWRIQDLPAVEQRGKEALALWQQSPLVYPFQWQALWPLITVALEQDQRMKHGHLFEHC